MGFVIFENSGTFNPSSYGLSVGDSINIICVGGGEPGNSVSLFANSSSACVSSISYGTGGASSFGSYLTAQGGSTSLKSGMGTGGSGSCGQGGGGAGGWLPGVQIFGGNGGCAAASTTAPTTLPDYYGHNPSGLGGIGGINYVNGITIPNPYANLRRYSGGNKGSGGSMGAGGNGYGAGGGGAAILTSHRVDGSTYFYYADGMGGNSGELKIATVILSDTNGIPVSVGSGGLSSHPTTPPNYDYSTLSGYYEGGKGAAGCVAIFW